MRGVVWVPGLLVAALACGGEGGGAPRDPDDGAPAAAALAAIAANPCDATLTTRGDAGDSTVARLLTGTSDLANEAHDCQRLVVADGTEFGPLVGLFPMGETLARGRAEFAVARPAVTVFNWGSVEGTYAETAGPLAPDRGAHCLWLHNPADAPTGWTAAIAAGTCGAPAAAPEAAAFVLPVFERTWEGAVLVDYPATARWEWDVEGARAFVGVRCGAAWCAVLPDGSVPPRTPALPEPLRGSDLVRLGIPGWSDGQHLAVSDSSSGRVRPGPWATVLSHPSLHDPDADWVDGILAAAIEVEDDGSAAFDGFAERFYLEPEAGGGRSDVILRFPGISPDEAWFQQGPMRRRQVTGGVAYTPATTASARGAVRWRWREGAPDLWIACKAGSCAVTD